mgnify:FL=1|jgi:hypothetical protein
MDNTFEALQDLYDIIEKCERRNVKLPEDVIRQINEAEENIIRDEILPIIGKDIEPTLSQIKRDLVLVVEYHPGEPVSVALSRKTKISEIVDAKPIVANPQKVSKPVKSDEAYLVAEPHEPIKTVTNHTKGLRVMFPDGTVVCNKTAIDTEIDVFRRIGFERVERVGRKRAGWPLVGKKQRPVEKGKIWQHESDGWFIYSNTNNEQKKEDLKAISDFYNLGLRISDGKPEK